MSSAYWRKCDFQIHTPRDSGWQGPRPIGVGDDNHGSAASDADVEASRATWADQLIDQCVRKGLEAIALTDHHETVMVPYVQSAIDRRRAIHSDFDLWLFPGMELTCHGGVQALILFDANLSNAWQMQVQHCLGIVTVNLNEQAARSPARVTQLPCNYADLAEKIDTLGDGIKGKYIILPNVSQGNQHTVLKDGLHTDFKRMPYVGGYVDNGQNISTLQPRNRRRLSGAESIWGSREIYPLPTSDSRHATFETLGGNNCWIKLAASTAEAIRQAFLGHKSRISIVRPKTASLAISQINLRGSTILKDASLALSPEFNSVIGGRGSGKSSMLEYIAFGLGRSCYDLTKHDYSASDRMKLLIKDTLIVPNGSIELFLEQDGAFFKVSRNSGSGYQPLVTYSNGTVQPVSAAELRALFPAVIYNQGELSELGKQAGKRPQLADLLQFVSQDYKKEDSQLAEAIESARESVRIAAQGLAGTWRHQAELHRLEIAKATLSQRISALSKTLPTLSEEDQKTLSHFDRLSAFEEPRTQASLRVEAIMTQLTQLWHNSKASVDLSTDAPEANKFIATFQAFDEAFWSGLEFFGRRLSERRNELNAAAEEWQAALNAAREARDVVMAKLGEHKTVTTQITTLQAEAETLGRQIAELRLTTGVPDDAATTMTQAVKRLKEAVRLRGEQTAAWAEEIETLSNGRIRATLNIEGDLSEIREAIDILAAKTGSQEAGRQHQTNDLIARSSAWDFVDSIRSECQNVLHYKILGASKNGDKPHCALLFQTVGGTARTHGTCFDLIDLTRLEAIAIAIPMPDISLVYCDNERTISFDKASEGQRAAALLFMLLQQAGGPLLVDQPEGDLDNSVISDLMEILHEAKQRRQIIFASHNANIVVNGSSELVSYLRVGDDGMRDHVCTGAIDLPEVCRTITATMEGGEKAFRDRKVKYGY